MTLRNRLIIYSLKGNLAHFSHPRDLTILENLSETDIVNSYRETHTRCSTTPINNNRTGRTASANLDLPFMHIGCISSDITLLFNAQPVSVKKSLRTCTSSRRDSPLIFMKHLLTPEVDLWAVCEEPEAPPFYWSLNVDSLAHTFAVALEVVQLQPP